MTVKQLSVNDLQKKIARNENIFLLDVREPNEFQYAYIANSTLIPLNQIPNRLTELDFKQEIIVLCHHGMRSQHAANYLIQSGFENVSNLIGGIDAWSCNCDHSIPRY